MVMEYLPEKRRKKRVPVHPDYTEFAKQALALKRGEVKEIDITEPKVLELARQTPYQELTRMAGETSPQGQLQYHAGGETDVEALKRRLTELRKKYRYAAPTGEDLAEINSIEEQLRKAGVTSIGQPSRILKKG
jgi:hypothetical protein